MNEYHTNFAAFNKFVCQMCFQCTISMVKCTNYEWTNVTQFLFLNHEMLSLWWMEENSTSVVKKLKLHTQ
jgi:hypothetical protein